MSAPLGRQLFADPGLNLTLLAIGRRRPLSPRSEEPLTDGRVSTTDRPASRVVLDKHLLRLPEVLERCDNLIQTNSTDGSRGRSLVMDIAVLQANVRHWFFNHSCAGNYADFQKGVTSVSAAESFNAGIEEHLIMTTNSTIDLFFTFHEDTNLAEDAVLFWLLGLILDCTLLRLAHFQPGTVLYLQPQSQSPQQIHDEAYQYAINLCRSVHSLSQHDSLGAAVFIDLIVTAAQHFFEESRAVRELGWTQAIRVATKLRAERMVATGARSQIWNRASSERIAASCRFRSRNLNV